MLGAVRRLDRHRRAAAARRLARHRQRRTSSSRCSSPTSRWTTRSTRRVDDGHFATKSGERLTRRALAGYAAAALIMPYAAFARAAEARHYDLEALARQFGTSFEQTAHRLTTLQRPGQEKVPVLPDPRRSGRQRLETAGRRGLSVRAPRRRLSAVVRASRVQHAAPDRHAVAGAAGRPALLLDRPHGDGRRRRVRRAARGARHRHRLRRRARRPADLHPRRQRRGPEAATPIGVTCRVCHRPKCTARSAPPIGRELLPDDFGGSACRSDFRTAEDSRQ